MGRGSAHDRACKHHCLSGQADVHVCVMLHTNVLGFPLLSTCERYANPVVQDDSAHQPSVQHRHLDIIYSRGHFYVHVSSHQAGSMGASH